MKLREILTEALRTFDNDIDRLYGLYLKEWVKALRDQNKTALQNYLDGGAVRSIPMSVLIKSGRVKNRHLIEADRISPAILTFNDTSKGNQFIPAKISRSGNDEIYVGIDAGVIRLVRKFEGSLDELTHIVVKQHDAPEFLQEFKGQRSKASLNHELNHWVDNAMNNRHIEDRILRTRDKQDQSILFQGKKTPHATHFEIEAFMGNIHQAKRANRAIWDEITFKEMLKLIPPAGGIITDYLERDKPLPFEYELWLRKVKQRMAREGLLGLRMR